MNFNEAIKQLYESFSEEDRMSPADVERLVYGYIEELKTIGKGWVPDWSLLLLDLAGYDSTNCLGSTSWETMTFGEDNTIVTIKISLCKYLFAWPLIDLLKNTFVHEYCHYMQLCEVVNDPDIDLLAEDPYHNMDPETILYYQDEEDTGHGECWQFYVRLANNKIKLKYKVVPNPDELMLEMYNKLNANEVTVIARCPHCGDSKMITFYEKSFESLENYDRRNADFLANVLIGTSRYTCKGCDGPFKVHFVYPEMRKQFEKDARIYLITQLLAKAARSGKE